MKTLEFLYPKQCNLYAERYNVDYLTKCSSEIVVTETNIGERPLFLDGKADLVYLGCTTEANQERIIKWLAPYSNEIIRAIHSDIIFLVTGNAIEIFGNYIKDGDVKIPALNIFDFYSERYMNEFRHNSQYIGVFNDGTNEITVLGHRSQFSFSYGEFPDPFVHIKYGIGMNPQTQSEGIHIGNFFATYSLGPYLILNPLFCKYILRKLGLNDDLCFEKEAIEAYQYRLKELSRLV